VQVRASFDGGSTYCPFGATCTVSIVPPPAYVSRGAGQIPTEVSIFPNPTNGTLVNLRIAGINGTDELLRFRLLDLSGKVVHDEQFAIDPFNDSKVISLESTLQQGAYLAEVTIGSEVTNTRLIVNR